MQYPSVPGSMCDSRRKVDKVHNMWWIPFVRIILQKLPLWMLAKAFPKSKFIHSSPCHSVHYSMMFLRVKMWSVQPLPCLNPACSFLSTLSTVGDRSAFLGIFTIIVLHQLVGMVFSQIMLNEIFRLRPDAFSLMGCFLIAATMSCLVGVFG